MTREAFLRHIDAFPLGFRAARRHSVVREDDALVVLQYHGAGDSLEKVPRWRLQFDSDAEMVSCQPDDSDEPVQRGVKALLAFQEWVGNVPQIKISDL